MEDSAREVINPVRRLRNILNRDRADIFETLSSRREDYCALASLSQVAESLGSNVPKVGNLLQRDSIRSILVSALPQFYEDECKTFGVKIKEVKIWPSIASQVTVPESLEPKVKELVSGTDIPPHSIEVLLIKHPSTGETVAHCQAYTGDKKTGSEIDKKTSLGWRSIMTFVFEKADIAR